MTKLKLFVWTGFSPDCTDGLAFAIAKTEDEAKKAVIETRGWSPREWGNLEIRNLSPCAYSVTGGG